MYRWTTWWNTFDQIRRQAERGRWKTHGRLLLLTLNSTKEISGSDVIEIGEIVRGLGEGCGVEVST